MNLKLKAVAGAIAAATSFSAFAGVVDDFTTVQVLIDSTANGSAVTSSVIGAGILGTERDASISATQIIIPGQDPNVNVTSGFLSLNSPSGSAGTLNVQWDGLDNSPSLAFGLGNFDLTGAGANLGFLIKTHNADAPFTFSVGAYNSAGQFSVVTFNGHETLGFQVNPVESFIPFAGFGACGFSGGDVVSVVCGGGGVNFSSLNALELTIVGTADLDLSIAEVTTVAEPGALVLMGSALFGLAAFRRRRAK